MSKCLLGQHAYEPIRGGDRERCTTCKDEFPCAHACRHVDCIVATGRELPEWITSPGYGSSVTTVTVTTVTP